MGRRMKLIPETEYEYLKKQKMEIPQGRKISSFLQADSSAKDILQSNNLPEDIQLQLFSSFMNYLRKNYDSVTEIPITKIKLDPIEIKYPDIISNIKQESEGQHNETERLETNNDSDGKNESMGVPLTTTDQTLLIPIPDAQIRVARILMERLKLYKQFIQWDEHGRVSFNNGESFESAVNISDLISASVRPNVTFDGGKGPIGFWRFKNLIKKLSIPTVLLTPKVRKAVLDLEKTAEKARSNSDSRASIATVLGQVDWEPLDQLNGTDSAID